MAVSASQARLAELVLMPTQWRTDDTHLIRKAAAAISRQDRQLTEVIHKNILSNEKLMWMD